MDIYILTKNAPQWDFVDGYGETANDYTEIIGVFGSIWRAEYAMHVAESEDEYDTCSFVIEHRFLE